ncbi:hypothetical protein OIO90_005069 [Microbotryomycetes sp. JL221]|nr:hypothetical protein OIO90_005069 [Microbotryomycetes sp. JL221]
MSASAWTHRRDASPALYGDEGNSNYAGVAGYVNAAAQQQQQQQAQAAAAAAASSNPAATNPGQAQPPQQADRSGKRRRMVERVSRLYEDTVARRDRVFQDLSEIFARTADELLPPPVFPTFDLNIPVGQLPPSLPFTDPVIPDMHPTPYLFALHRLSHQRANSLLAIKLFHLHQVAVARKLYDAEVERTEDEYESASKGVVDRLLEGVEERRRRLTEDKEGDGTTLESFLDPQARSHGTRRMRGNGRTAGNRTAVPRVGSPDLAASSAVANGVANGSTSGRDSPAPENPFASLLTYRDAVSDPFNIMGTFLPNPHTAHTSAHPLLSALAGPSTNTTIIGKRKLGPRAQPGLPPAHYSIPTGTYPQFGKSLAGLSALRGDEIEGDLGEVRRKRARNAGGGSGRRRINNGD